MTTDADALLPIAAGGHVSVPPDQVAARLKRYAAHYQLAMAPATVRAVRGDWSTYSTWCASVGCPELKWIPREASDEEREAAEDRGRAELAAFFEDAIARGLRRATLDRYLFTIRLAHSAARVSDPSRTPEWKLIWKRFTRELAKDNRNRRRPAAPLRQAMLAKVLPNLGADLRELRDAALLCLAADTLARREELARASVEELKRRDAGTGQLEIPTSKTDAAGHGLLRHVSAVTMEYLERWLQAGRVKSGPMFRAVRFRGRGDKRKAQVGEKALAPQEIARIFKRRLAAAGFDASRISGHSTRIGTTQDLVTMGYTGAAIARVGGWANDAMVSYYARELETDDTAIAQARARQPLPAPRASEHALGPGIAVVDGAPTTAAPSKSAEIDAPPTAILPVAPAGGGARALTAHASGEVKVAPTGEPASRVRAAPPTPPPPRAPIAVVTLDLRLEANSKYVRTRKRALSAILDVLEEYGCQPTKREDEFGLRVPYTTVAALRATLDDLAGEIDDVADMYDCFTECSFRAHGIDLDGDDE